MPKHGPLLLLLALCALPACATAAAASPAGPAYLSADEVRKLIVGKTVEVQGADGATIRVYFDPNGKRLSLRASGEFALPWRILPDGTQCVTTGSGEDCARLARNADGTYTRHRDDGTTYRWLRFLPGKVLVDAVPAPGIRSRQTGPNQYEVQVSGPTLDEKQARAQVAIAAGSICKTLVPVLGKYQFDSVKPVAAGDSPGGASTFRFVQEISCVPGTNTAPVERRPTLQTAEESRRVQEEIRDRSAAYFQLLAANRLDEAYAQVDVRGMGLDADAWKRGKQSFRTLAGEPVQVSIAKLTVFDNPPDAAEPGLYVAANYLNEYRNVPVHCGFLMWFRPIGGGFRITREETGHITAEQLKSIPAAQLPEVKRSLRCVEP